MSMATYARDDRPVREPEDPRRAAGVLVTHEARHAAWADRVVFLRDGVIVDTSGPVGRPEQLLTEAQA